ncbi:hypothetical protein [Paraburkholderia sacchari]|uniref:hypothetical protein n=1 Tax=Paraburkholderia sacchari TaxID=159450 RepID=UPI000543F551|nr:hypothetical protein [Paraburkholderia sacchari]NLP65561.1 hypothetical protein [Paraburkholderia sacchari]
MSLLPEFAVAQLVMLEGTVCSVAELSMYLETFGYREDPHAQGRWVFDADDAAHAECRLVVENEGELITVYGEAVDHFTNINYVVQKAGWHRCSVLTRDKDVEAKLLARLVSVDVTTTSDDMPASTLQASMHPASAPLANEPDLASAPSHSGTPDTISDAEPTRELDDSHHRIEQLTVRCNMAEERSAELESTNRALTDDNNSLRTQLRAIEAEIATAQSAPRRSSPSMPASGGDHATDALQLVEAIERYLSAQIAMPSADGAPLLADLQRLGYEPRLRLVKVA